MMPKTLTEDIIPALKEKLDENGGGKLYSSYGSNTDGALTQKFVSDILNGKRLSLGKGSQVLALESSAIGVGAKVLSGADSSMALGDHSEADRPNEASIGYKEIEGVSAQYTRYLSNLKAGELDTDAVNLKQLRDAIAASQPVVLYSGVPEQGNKTINLQQNVNDFDFVEVYYVSERGTYGTIHKVEWSKSVAEKIAPNDINNIMLERFGVPMSGLPATIFVYDVWKFSGTQLDYVGGGSGDSSTVNPGNQPGFRIVKVLGYKKEAVNG